MDKTNDLFEKCRLYDEPDRVKAAGLYPYFRPIEKTSGSTVYVHGRKQVMIGSNNYLGLTHHPKVIEAAQRAVAKYGTGCTGSRFLNGNLDCHEELEEKLAKFVGQEQSLVFNSGFLANLGTLNCIMGRKDVIYCDRENHASIFEGTRSSFAQTVKFRHNDMADLKRVMVNTRHKFEGALVVADGVFSMSGDILNLPQVVKIAKQYNCRVFVDDAHAIGVLGDCGRGTADHYGITEGIDIVMGTFSKSFASIGGFIAGGKDVIKYVKHKSRPFIFSASMPPAAVGAVLECLRIVQEEPHHLRQLWTNARRMKRELDSLGYNTLNSQTPVIPLLVGEDYTAFSFAQKLLEFGVFATPVIKPAVPDGCALIRTSYMASHTDEDLTYVLEVLEKLGREFGIIEDGRKEELAMLAETHFGRAVREEFGAVAP